MVTDRMKFWVCPKCQCVNEKSTAKCDGCGVPLEAVLLLPTSLSLWVEFPDVAELDKWIVAMQRLMGAEIWRKTK
jgi:hypothetical protein